MEVVMKRRMMNAEIYVSWKRICISFLMVLSLMYLYVSAVRGSWMSAEELECTGGEGNLAENSVMADDSVGVAALVPIEDPHLFMNTNPLNRAATLAVIEEFGDRIQNPVPIGTDTVLQEELVTVEADEKNAYGSVAEDTGVKEEESVGTIPVICTLTLHGNGGNPEVSSYTGTAGELNALEWTIPRRPGKIFDGWYRDVACTVPYEGSMLESEEIELYAGWREFTGYLSDDRGYVTGYTDEISVEDGILTVPTNPDCIGITAHAFDGLEELVTEIYIPANVTYIEEGAFDGMYNLMYIEADASNPVYYSKYGVLYSYAGEVIAAPGS